MLCSQAAKVVASRGFTRFKIKDSSSKGSERNQSLWIKKKKKFVDFSGLLGNFLVVMLTWQKLSSPNYMQP